MKENEKIKEFAIKKILLTHLLKCEDDSNSYAITEFSIANFTRRVDVFFVKDDTLHAFEIKSEFDSLNRLEGQISEYLNHFDKVTIVAASKFIPNILLKTPSNVGIWEIKDTTFKIIRQGRISRVKDKLTFVRMMTLVELINLSKKQHLNITSRKRIDIEVLVSKLPIYLLRGAAIENIKNRYRKRGGNFYNYSELQTKAIIKTESKKKNMPAISYEKKLDSFLQAIKAIKDGI
ncbi:MULTISPECIES: sce7726 family protein [Enterobacter cloacae complex]|uniref:sce7726 family protein n=1 Tax=Enterobacter cloacae complex TaxID=354276 RepID=UPI003459D7DA